MPTTVTDKRAYQGTATTDPTTVEFNGRPKAIRVKNRSESVALLVCVPELHGDQFVAIDAGDDLPFSDEHGLASVILKTAATTADYDVSALVGRTS